MMDEREDRILRRAAWRGAFAGGLVGGFVAVSGYFLTMLTTVWRFH